MIFVDYLLNKFKTYEHGKAITVGQHTYRYKDLLFQVKWWLNWLTENKIEAGSTVVIKGDYSIDSISLMLSLIKNNCILAPLSVQAYNMLSLKPDRIKPSYLIDLSTEKIKKTQYFQKIIPQHYLNIKKEKKPGLILLTSGSSGVPKIVIHDFSKLLEKFFVKDKKTTILNFLLFDHWGGLNTLIHGLASLNHIIIPEKRGPFEICRLIENYKIKLLPTTPSFINMLLISKAYKKYNLDSLELTTYGAEPMAQKTLNHLLIAFPKIELKQTYGMIEIGVMATKTRDKGSLWMLGYLDNDNPFTSDGYMRTGDLVEVDGEWMKIIGRKSDTINIGGQKIHPREVEQIILDYPIIIDAHVYKEKNKILGNIIVVDIIILPEKVEEYSKLKFIEFC